MRSPEEIAKTIREQAIDRYDGTFEWDEAEAIIRAAQEEAYAAGRAAGGSNRWQPIETAPKDETNVLLYAPRAEFGMVLAFHNGEGWYTSEAASHEAEFLYGPFTAWAPLPPVDGTKPA